MASKASEVEMKEGELVMAWVVLGGTVIAWVVLGGRVLPDSAGYYNGSDGRGSAGTLQVVCGLSMVDTPDAHSCLARSAMHRQHCPSPANDHLGLVSTTY
jgi:hypothetical protein